LLSRNSFNIFTGIGLAAAKYLLQQKCKLVVVARSQAPLEEIKSQYPDEVEILAGDLGDLSLGASIVDLTLKTFGRLDGIIINHGVLAPVTRISESNAEDWSKTFNINIFSAVSIVRLRGSYHYASILAYTFAIQIKEALPELRKNRGKIIFTSSGAATGAYATWGAYGASKAAMNHLAMTLAVEEPEVVFISIRPGTVDTEMQRELREIHHTSMDKKDADRFAQLKASGGLLRPDQPGNVLAKLVLDGSPDLSGKFVS
jgi:NAD(P)-dependent dehydrogenase (short-subunit alcohol dehydrogenase family)